MRFSSGGRPLRDDLIRSIVKRTLAM